MSTVVRRISVSALLILALLATGYANEAAKSLKVPAGQKINLEGVILNREADTLIVRNYGGAVYRVVINDGTELKERKSNPFRGSKKYSINDLVSGLQVEVKGMGTNSGALAASEVRFRNDDHIVAQTMDTRVIPVENDLNNTKIRLGETEQNAERLSGQIQELTAITNMVRSDARTAQATADSAVLAASNAQSTADSARIGVRATNERINRLDDFDVKSETTVYFKAGSAVLTREYKEELGDFAEQVRSEKGYLIEVAGFASSDGDVAANRLLSQKRADAVIQYLAEKYLIPMRRFVTPMGYGASHPVGDNRTRAGRDENRRVEVRLLVSLGVNAPSDSEEAEQISQVQ